VYRIRIHGRGGQGIKMASRVLGTALFRSGFTVQDAPKYGAERRGAPIFSNVRAARGEGGAVINERGTITRPDLVVVADDTLLAVPAAGTLLGIGPQTVLLVNSHQGGDSWRSRLNLEREPLILPASEEVEDRAELPHIGATCAGAAACLLGVVEREALAEAIDEELAELGRVVVAENRRNSLAAWDAMAPHRGAVSEGAAIDAAGYQPPGWIDLPLDDARVAAPAIRAVANSVQVRTGLWRTLRPEIDYQLCGKCWWVCSTLCPDGAIAVKGNLPEIDYDHCKGCMICVGVCPPHAIVGVPEYLAQQRESAAVEEHGDGADTAHR
jgi:pyruvate ferredoxin oxidoreductase gamma subunit